MIFTKSINLVIVSIFARVAAWNGDKHRTIGELAATIMRPRTREFLTDRVGDIAEASVWADTEEAEIKYPLSYAYHFSFTPYRNCDKFDFKRDCGTIGETKGICLVSGLARSISIAVNPEASQEALTDALKFIIHLMADIHQPLHTGFRVDRGGGRVFLNNGTSTLHQYWDALPSQLGATTDLLIHLRERLDTTGVRFLDTIRSEFNATNILSSSASVFEFVAALASETSTTVTCPFAYKNERNDWVYSGELLSGDYADSRSRYAVVQLLKSAVRLALLADAIREKFEANRDARKTAMREARVAALFSTSIKREVSEVVVDCNPFNVLGIDMDLSECAWDGPTHEDLPLVIDKKLVGGKTVSKSTLPTFDDDTLIDAAATESRRMADAIAIRKAAMVIHGINIDDIVLVNRQGKRILTYKSLIQRKGYTIMHTRRITYPFSEQSNSTDGSSFNVWLDNEVFGDDIPPLEVHIRMLLKIRGVDPLIDISEIQNKWYTTLKAKRQVQDPFVDRIHARFRKEISEEPIMDKKSVVARIKSMRGHMFRFVIRKKTYVFVHNSTLYAEGAIAPYGPMRFHVFYNGDDHVFVDPVLLGGRYEHYIDGEILRPLLDSSTVSIIDFFSRLGWSSTRIRSLVKTNMAGIPFGLWSRYTQIGKVLLDDITTIGDFMDDKVEFPSGGISGFYYLEDFAHLAIHWFRSDIAKTNEEIWNILDKTNVTVTSPPK